MLLDMVRLALVLGPPLPFNVNVRACPASAIPTVMALSFQRHLRLSVLITFVPVPRIKTAVNGVKTRISDCQSLLTPWKTVIVLLVFDSCTAKAYRFAVLFPRQD